MRWIIKCIFNFTESKLWGHGFCNLGFHGNDGSQYMLQYEEHWLGCLSPTDEFAWTAGSVDKGLSQNHLAFDLKRPHFVAELPDGSLIISSAGTNKIYRVPCDRRAVNLFIDTGRAGLKDLGNCVYDNQGSIWVNEIEGCRVWRFDLSGKPTLTLGSEVPGSAEEMATFESARFNWIYDLRLGPDGNIYVLDSKNFCVRMIDTSRGTVSRIVGTGQPGYSGDGGPAQKATLGSDLSHYFDGPLALALDEDGNIYIGDTRNHVVRMVDHASRQISTIAGTRNSPPSQRNDPGETNPLALRLPEICSMDYYRRCLFVPDMSGGLAVLEKVD